MMKSKWKCWGAGLWPKGKKCWVLGNSWADPLSYFSNPEHLRIWDVLWLKEFLEGVARKYRIIFYFSLMKKTARKIQTRRDPRHCLVFFFLLIHKQFMIFHDQLSSLSLPKWFTRGSKNKAPESFSTQKIRMDCLYPFGVFRFVFY